MVRTRARNPLGRRGLRAISSLVVVEDGKASSSSSRLDLAAQAPSAIAMLFRNRSSRVLYPPYRSCIGTGGRVISLVVRSVLHGRVSNDFPVGAPSRGSLGIDTRETYSLVIILASGELIGGRAIEVIFYEWECYGSHLWQIPALWLGGIRSEQGPSFRLRLLSLH